MTTKATISYIDADKTQDCVTGRIIKNTENLMIIHPKDTKGSSLKFNKEVMKGSILETSSSDTENIGIIEYSTWSFDSEIHFLLPNKSLSNKNEVIISGIYDSKKTISGNKITIETDDTLFKLNYHQDTSSWQLNENYIVGSKMYDFDIYYSPNYCSYIFYIVTNNNEICDLKVNSKKI